MTSEHEPTVAVIVVAAGTGSRLSARAPKAFVSIAGRTILERALDPVFAMVVPTQVIVVVPAERLAEAERLVQGTGAWVVAGGSTRQASVAAGVAAITPQIETVLVHDSARALTPAWLFDSVVTAVAATNGGVVPGLDVTDTIKEVDPAAEVLSTLDRSRLTAVQTPQGFPRAALTAAYAVATVEHTDDAALFAAAGHAVTVVPGDPRAFKITTPWDLRRAESLVAEVIPSELNARVAGSLHDSNGFGMRTGIGVDVHAYDDARPLWLGDVYWPDEVGLAGHSDGDAVCHALCDALLSAAGLGDIGGRFGTSDPRFDGAHGAVFIRETIALVTGAGFTIGNIAVQLVADHPKLAERRMEVENHLTDLVGAPVSVSATTSDGLGFTGKGEGVAAIATALIHHHR